MLGSLRGYFLGVTIVAAFNAVVVTLGALILGVPLIGTIAAVTFFGAYIPYLGAWAAGAFAVLIALGGAGTDAAVGMIVVQLLANGVLQQLVQPFAMGAALGIHPLAVLIVTIAGGAAVRDDRADPRRAADLGRGPDLGRPGTRQGAGARSGRRTDSGRRRDLSGAYWAGKRLIDRATAASGSSSADSGSSRTAPIRKQRAPSAVLRLAAARSSTSPVDGTT